MLETIFRDGVFYKLLNEMDAHVKPNPLSPKFRALLQWRNVISGGPRFKILGGPGHVHPENF